MALHDDLLSLSRRLVPPYPAPPAIPLGIVQADLRRGVSTAYYALFHLLIHEATMRIVADPALRERVGRSFAHGQMKQVCQEYSGASMIGGFLSVRSGVAIAPQLQDVGSSFVDLQQARHDADYDTATALSHADADFKVSMAETAFADWSACQPHPSAGVFLTDLFLRSLPKR